MSDGGVLPVALELASAFCGIYGTYLMSKKYAEGFVTELVLALATPAVVILRSFRPVREFYESRVRAKEDSADRPFDTAFGLNLLFWAFLLQVVRVVVS